MKLVEIIEKIVIDLMENKRCFSFKNMLIIGENNSGKSKIIKEVLKKIIGKEWIYFIDSCNRDIVVSQKDIVSSFNDLDIVEVAKRRIDDKYFNKLDTFTEE